MVMHAYPCDYVNMAQRIMGDMLDYAVNTYDVEIDEFFGMFIVSDISKQFQSGNPTYVAGKTGCELFKEVIAESGLKLDDKEDVMYIDKTAEYWTGWALAYYQWYTGRTFAKIWNAVKLKDIVDMYPVYHEMDIQQFVDRMNELWESYYIDTNLKRIRMLSGYSQRELSELSGVSLSQLFEQRQRNINHTKAENVFRLAKILNCKCEDLIEI